jgi:ABC-type polysaccharide/polyol phosphate export permease
MSAVSTGLRPTLSARPAARQRLQHWADLVVVLSIKNFRQRYLRSKLGVIWALLQPTVQALVLAFVFTKIFKIHHVPHFPVYVLSGVLLWQLFQQSVNQGTSAVVDNAGLVKKVAVPKVVFPLSAVGGCAIVYVAQLVVITTASFIVGTERLVTPLYAALALLLALNVATGLGVLACSFHVRVRDIRFLIESGLLVAFYITPILYDPSKFGPTLRHLLLINPMYGVMSLQRAAFLDRPVAWAAVGASTLLSTVILAVALAVFRHRSRDFADLV